MTRNFLRHIRVQSSEELQDRILQGIAEINAAPIVNRWKRFDVLFVQCGSSQDRFPFVPRLGDTAIDQSVKSHDRPTGPGKKEPLISARPAFIIEVNVCYEDLPAGFIPVSIPYTHREVSSIVQRDGVTDILVKVTTDDGLVGWGESCSGANVESVPGSTQGHATFRTGAPSLGK